MHIVAYRPQVARAAAIHHQGFIATAENMPKSLVPGIESQRIGTQQPTHARHQIPVGRLNHQVKMIAHQTVGMNLKTALLARLRQRLDKFLPVHIRFKNLPLPLARLITW